MLKLRIENVDRLQDGGPLSFQADQRGFDIGRDQHLDWTLPDPTRYISGKHCEIRFSDGAYWLNDVSTNGTFVNKGARRVQSPYRIADGDELQIGEYIISATITGEGPVAAHGKAGSDESANVPIHDTWGASGEVPPPIGREDLLPPVQRGSRAADFFNSVANIPTPGGGRGQGSTAPPSSGGQSFGDSQPGQRPPAKDPWGVTGFTSQEIPAAPPTTSADPPPVTHFPSAAMGHELSFSGNRPPQAPKPQPAYAPPDPPRPAPPAASSDTMRAQLQREFIQHFALAANIPEEVLAKRDAAELAQELGTLMRIVCANLMQLLRDRAAAKALSRSGQRTLIQHMDNNPLKFMPSPEEAIRVMLGPQSGSYLDGRQTFERSFADLRTHQIAIFSAMQQAFMQTMEGLSPEAIEQSGKGQGLSLLSSNKSRHWDLFVERWKAKAGRNEHGMLDAFVNAFAEQYDRESKPKR